MGACIALYKKLNPQYAITVVIVKMLPVSLSNQNVSVARDFLGLQYSINSEITGNAMFSHKECAEF
jgi:hypothetical protein